MNKPTFATLALVLGLFLGTPAVHAGTVQLTVTDKDNNPVPDTVVVINLLPKTPAKPAAAPVPIVQENSRFVPFLTVVPVGSTLRFINRDGYDHHVRSTPSGPLGSIPAAKSFEVRLDPGKAPDPNDPYASPAPRKGSGVSQADIKMDQAGAIGLGCHLHGSMRGQVYVSDSPWFAKTDAKGVATIEGVPEGNGNLVLWHPDQLQDQAPYELRVGVELLKANAQLNFTPRRRRS
jgi:plastocyanin